MENNKECNDQSIDWEKAHRRGKFIAGLLIVTAGSLYLAKEMGTAVPEWIFTWKTLLIAIGIHVAVKHKFRFLIWLPLVLTGSIFLITQDFYPELSFGNLLWPTAIIIIGLFVMFKPRRKCYPHQNWKCHKKKHIQQHFQSEENSDSENFIQSEIIFSGVKKNIISKDFKGGSIRIIFGGAELNFSQSDIIGKAEIEIDQVFGGLKLIVPANWKVQSEVATIMSGVEDKRNFRNDVSTESDKILVLKGNVIFGGIEIKSY